MLTTSQSPKYAYLRKVAVLPMLAITLVLFSLHVKAQEKKAKKSSGTEYKVTIRPDSTTFSDPKTGNKVFSVATKEMPVPPATKAEKSAAFHTSSSDIKVVYLDSTTVEFKGNNKEGKAITFRAEKVKNSADSPTENGDVLLKPVSSPKEKPLIVIDGVITTDIDLNQISPNNIESINVLKDENAAKKYADKGANGVVEITTKKK